MHVCIMTYVYMYVVYMIHNPNQIGPPTMLILKLMPH